MLKNCTVLAPSGIGTSTPSTRRDMTPGRRYFREENNSVIPRSPCPATTLLTLSAQHGVRSRSWWNCIAMDASNPTEKKHTDVFVTVATSSSSPSSPSASDVHGDDSSSKPKPAASKSIDPPPLTDLACPRRVFNLPNPTPLIAGPCWDPTDITDELRRWCVGRIGILAPKESRPPFVDLSSLEIVSFASPSGPPPPEPCIRFGLEPGDLGLLTRTAPGGVIGGGANRSSGWCGKSSLSIASPRAKSKSYRTLVLGEAFGDEESGYLASQTLGTLFRPSSPACSGDMHRPFLGGSTVPSTDAREMYAFSSDESPVLPPPDDESGSGSSTELRNMALPNPTP
mmetsp:Transcript_2250/g.5813  ORF Transcript_2250/g.5813 Transcript_2250/m.5813 type:complete len:341 (+) Transcript_2250:499-1521(+)